VRIAFVAYITERTREKVLAATGTSLAKASAAKTSTEKTRIAGDRRQQSRVLFAKAEKGGCDRGVQE
jgi:hypothetical protein